MFFELKSLNDNENMPMKFKCYKLRDKKNNLILNDNFLGFELNLSQFLYKNIKIIYTKN